MLAAEAGRKAADLIFLVIASAGNRAAKARKRSPHKAERNAGAAQSVPDAAARDPETA